MQSRYYDSITSRYLNADSMVASTGNLQGYNLFSYCNNNPVNMDDESGHWPKWLTGALAIVSGVTGAALGATAGRTGIVVSYLGGRLISSIQNQAYKEVGMW